MPIFLYVAKNKSGHVIRGRAEAENEKALTGQLQVAGLWVTQIKKDTVQNKDIGQDGAAKVDVDLLRRQSQTLLNKRWKRKPQADGSIRLIQTAESRHEASAGGV
jgi:type II secretory pathway component PulF